MYECRYFLHPQIQHAEFSCKIQCMKFSINTSLKRNGCIIINHLEWVHLFCCTGRTLSGWSKTVDKPLWWHNLSRQYWALSGMIQIRGWLIKVRLLLGASSWGTPYIHWNYRLLLLQLPLAMLWALHAHCTQRAAGFRSPHHITPSVGTGTSITPSYHTKRRHRDLHRPIISPQA